jgi:hypothetical protein
MKLFPSFSTFGFLVLLATQPACSSDSSSEEGASSPTFKCQTSTAKSGSLCQVNFNCESGDSPAAYCDDTGSCSCGAAASNPKKFTSPGICEKSRDEMATIANKECGFGQ